MRRLLTIFSGVTLSLALSASITAAAAGPPALSFYIDGVRYRTVGTPTEFTHTGAPAHSFEAIYALGGDLINVAEAAPGQPGFRGGRWMVLPVTWHTTPVQLTSNEQIEAYADAGLLSIGTIPAQEFECPVIRANTH